MKSNKLTAALAVAATLTAAGATAQQFEDYARVQSVTPEYEKVNTPRQECRTEYVPSEVRRSEERGYAGPIIGGITGAIVGNTVGKGGGNKAATAIGAVTGAIVGDRIQNSRRDDDGGYYEERAVRRCQNVDQWESRLTGYRVVYDYHGHSYTTMLPYEPGRRLKVNVSVAPAEGDRQTERW